MKCTVGFAGHVKMAACENVKSWQIINFDRLYTLTDRAYVNDTNCPVIIFYEDIINEVPHDFPLPKQIFSRPSPYNKPIFMNRTKSRIFK